MFCIFNPLWGSYGAPEKKNKAIEILKSIMTKKTL